MIEIISNLFAALAVIYLIVQGLRHLLKPNGVIAPMRFLRLRRLSRIEHVGAYFVVKTLDRLAETQDHYTVAKQLRKQGVPLDIARIILFGRN